MKINKNKGTGKLKTSNHLRFRAVCDKILSLWNLYLRLACKKRRKNIGGFNENKKI